MQHNGVVKYNFNFKAITLNNGWTRAFILREFLRNEFPTLAQYW